MGSLKGKMPETDEEWRKKLSAQAYRVLRRKGTEIPFTGELLHNRESGVYTCGGCGEELFSSDTKFDSGTGWPSFSDIMNNRNVKTHTDSSLGMKRTEVVCAKCGGHLGHVFDDGPTPTGKRYCINSCALGFKKTKK